MPLLSLLSPTKIIRRNFCTVTSIGMQSKGAVRHFGSPRAYRSAPFSSGVYALKTPAGFCNQRARAPHPALPALAVGCWCPRTRCSACKMRSICTQGTLHFSPCVSFRVLRLTASFPLHPLPATAPATGALAHRSACSLGGARSSPPLRQNGALRANKGLRQNMPQALCDILLICSVVKGYASALHP